MIKDPTVSQVLTELIVGTASGSAGEQLNEVLLASATIAKREHCSFTDALVAAFDQRGVGTEFRAWLAGGITIETLVKRLKES
jgi:hypothetical protein